MRFLCLTALFTLSTFARPIEKEGKAGPHPAIATYNYVSNQLATIITEIRLFDPQNPQTDAIYRHGMEAMETINKANSEVAAGGEFDMWTTTTFMPALASLDYQAHQLKNALTDKKPEIDQAQAGLVFYKLLKQCFESTKRMRDVTHSRMPQWFSDMTKPIVNEAVSTIEQARDLFKPKDGDIDVVVITQPNGQPTPYYPGSAATSAPYPSGPPPQYQGAQWPPPGLQQPPQQGVVYTDATPPPARRCKAE